MFRSKRSIAANNALTNAITLNTVAINNQVAVQRESNKLQEKDLLTKDRVDISLKEYETLKCRDRFLTSVEAVLEKVAKKCGLTVEELANIDVDSISVYTHQDYERLGLNLRIVVPVHLPLYRERQVLEHSIL